MAGQSAFWCSHPLPSYFRSPALEGPAAGATTPQAKGKARAKAKAKAKAQVQAPGQVQEQGQKTVEDVRAEISPKLSLINVFQSAYRISYLVLSSCGLRYNPEEGCLATQQCDLGIAKECFADKPWELQKEVWRFHPWVAQLQAVNTYRAFSRSQLSVFGIPLTTLRLKKVTTLANCMDLKSEIEDEALCKINCFSLDVVYVSLMSCRSKPCDLSRPRPRPCSPRWKSRAKVTPRVPQSTAFDVSKRLMGLSRCCP